MKQLFREFTVAGQQVLAAVTQCTVPCHCRNAQCGGLMMVDAVALSTFFGDGERAQLTMDHRSQNPDAPYELLAALSDAHVADLVQVMAAGFYQTMSTDAMNQQVQRVLNDVTGRNLQAVRFGQV